MNSEWKIIHSLPQLEEFREEWERILEESGSDSIFLTYQWIFSWLRTFGLNGEIMILRGRGEGWEGIFPLFVRKIPFVAGVIREIACCGDPYSDQCNFIISGDRKRALKAFLKYLTEINSRWDLIRLKEIPADSAVGKNLPALLRRSAFTFRCRGCDVSPYIPLPRSWETYFQSLSRSFRKKIRKYFRQLEKYGEYELKEIPLGPDLWRSMEKISRRSPKFKTGITMAERPRALAFLKELLPRLQAQGWVKYSLLTVSGRPISYDLAFRYQGTIWSYKAAFDEKYSAASPGHLQLALLIEDAIRAGYREFNLLRGGEAYKYNWTDKKRAQLEIHIYNRNFSAFVRRWADIFRRTAAFLLKKQFRFLGETGMLKRWSDRMIRILRNRGRRIPITATVRKGGLSLKVFENLEEIRDLKESWNPLLKSARVKSIFMTYEWIISWMETYGKDKQIMVLAAYKKNQLIGLCPLFIEKKKFIFWSVKTIDFAGAPRTDRADFIIEKNKEEVLELFWDYLWEQRSRWTVIRLKEIEVSSFNLTVFGDLLKQRGIKHSFHTCSIAPFITLNQPWDEYLMGRSKKFRNRMRSDRRKIKRAGDVEFKEVSPTADVWKTIFDINSRSNKAARGVNMFSDPRAREFIQKVVRRFEKRGWEEVKFLLLDDIPIAYRIDFVYAGKVWLYNSAFRPDYGKYHPGYVIQAYNIEKKIKEGFREVDFLRGSESYKFRYTNELRYHREVMIYKKSLISFTLRWLYYFKEIFKFIVGDKLWGVFKKQFIQNG